jgi:ribosomal protein L20
MLILRKKQIKRTLQPAFAFCCLSSSFLLSEYQVNYGNFMHGLVKENVQLNRKVLSELSMHEPYSFKALVDVSRTAFPGSRPPAQKQGLAAVL